MNIQTRYVFLFIFVISISFIPFMGIYSIMIGRTENLWWTILVNIPACLLLGVCDFLLVKKTQHKVRSNVIRLITDIMVTTVTTIVIICGLNLLLMDAADATPHVLLKSAVPAIPWNWIVTLLIELFFYNEQQQKIEREKSHYQFMALRNQINPHFLFNCLNVLSSLAYSDAEKANNFAKRLASVYRYILSTNESQIVDIDDEIACVNKYIYLEQVRFGDFLSVKINDMRATHKGHIIPVSVQQLVENAIKHNICSKEFPLKIEILITDTDIKVVNNVQLRKASCGTGVGLDNIRRQYALHNKKITVSVSDTSFTVSLPIIH